MNSRTPSLEKTRPALSLTTIPFVTPSVEDETASRARGASPRSVAADQWYSVKAGVSAL